MKKQIIILFFLCLFSIALKEELFMKVKLQNAELEVSSDEFRAHVLDEKVIEAIRATAAEKRGHLVGEYFLKSKIPDDNEYVEYCNAIWNDIEYFPVPVSTKNKDYTVSFVDSWFAERTYGGTRGHEGTDIMASEDKPGLYPIVSMTDGVIAQMGWLEKGGYRIGILAPSGGYFYYAHLDSYSNLKVGDEISAGDIIGFMGDSGYGPEGTTGMFATHLHLGIYLYPEGEEISINPYSVLKMIEEKKLSCSF